MISQSIPFGLNECVKHSIEVLCAQANAGRMHEEKFPCSSKLLDLTLSLLILEIEYISENLEKKLKSEQEY